MATPYQNSRIALVTKHAKEVAIAPIFKEILGADVITLEIDTDKLGTFSGEILRIGTALETAQRKCELGLENGFLKVCLASEGSFGPHPDNPFVPYDHEILYFVDHVKKFHLWTSVFSMDTNYSYKVANSFDDVLDFLDKINFPSHGVIVRPNISENKKHIVKGIRSREDLIAYFEKAAQLSQDKAAYIETDMRAHMNPSRMRVIADAAKKLAAQLKTLCPNCESPGWGLKFTEPGLECSSCLYPTSVVKFEIMGCVQCPYQIKQLRDEGLKFSDPSFCPICNP